MDFMDIEQDDKIKVLERRVKMLEREVRGESKMSNIIKDIIGQDCEIHIDYDNLKCRILDADDCWVKLLVYGKKGETTCIRRVDDITEIKL